MLTEELPSVLTAAHISDYLHISRKRVYELMDLKEFPLIQIGTSKRVTKEAFFRWLNSKEKK